MTKNRRLTGVWDRLPKTRLFTGRDEQLPRCRCCREPWTRGTSDATDPDTYCSAACERGELSEPPKEHTR